MFLRQNFSYFRGGRAAVFFFWINLLENPQETTNWTAKVQVMHERSRICDLRMHNWKKKTLRFLLLLMRLSLRNNNFGLQIWILTLPLRNLTYRFSPYKPTPESMQHIKGKRTSKHGTSMIMSSQCGVMERGCISGSYAWGAPFIGKFLNLKQSVR